MTRFVQNYQLQKGGLPEAPFDPPWPSPCTDAVESNEGASASHWRPVKREDYALFSKLEEAFECPFHSDIACFYGAYWSNGIEVIFDQLHFNLIQVWNEEDEDMLKENLLGHLFAKRKNRLPLTYFIGCTDGNDVIALDHETGQIVLEKPGYRAHQVLADSLEQLLLRLEPAL